MSDMDTNDEELEALMAELEAQNANVLAEKAAHKSDPEVHIPDDQEIAELEAVVAEIDEGTSAGDLPNEDERHESTEIHSGEESLVDDAPSEPEPEPEPEQKSAKDGDGDVLQPAVVGFELGDKPVGFKPSDAVGPAGLHHYVDVDQFRKDTRVSDVNLDQCMIEQNGLRAYYAVQAANAEAQAARIKAKFEVIEATLYDHHRKDLASDPAAKVTEKAVENAVKLDPRWLKAKNLVIEAETIASINKGLVQSLADRRDMIIQLGADRRDEYKGAARVMAEKNERDELRQRAMRGAAA